MTQLMGKSAMTQATAAQVETLRKTLRTSARGSHRTEQVARAAAQLFQEYGYQNVSVDRIGAAVGLTGPAVYRHFKGKRDILVHALMTQVQLVEKLHGFADEHGVTAEEQLQLILAGFAELAAYGDEATLWRREQRHLNDAEREVFQQQYEEARRRIAAKVIDTRPEVGRDRADLMGITVLAMFSNTPNFRGNMSADRLQELQIAAAWAIIECDLPEPDPDTPTLPAVVQRQPAGRRERIIHAAAHLFGERGFYDVRIDDIAKAAEMSTATLYQHVSSKTEVLRAVLERGAEGLLYVTADALAYTSTPREALDALIDTYIRQALGVYGRIMSILAADLLYLSDEEQSALRNAQREYVAEWVQAIESLSDDLSTADARVLAQAAISIVTEVTQNADLRGRPGLAEALTALVRAMVLPANLTAS